MLGERIVVFPADGGAMKRYRAFHRRHVVARRQALVYIDTRGGISTRPSAALRGQPFQ